MKSGQSSARTEKIMEGHSGFDINNEDLNDETSFCSLQEKVEKCLEDGVRLPMLDLKQLERENTRLLEQQSQNSLVLISHDAPNDA